MRKCLRSLDFHFRVAGWQKRTCAGLEPQHPLPGCSTRPRVDIARSDIWFLSRCRILAVLPIISSSPPTRLQSPPPWAGCPSVRQEALPPASSPIAQRLSASGYPAEHIRHGAACGNGRATARCSAGRHCASRGRPLRTGRSSVLPQPSVVTCHEPSSKL